MTKLVILHGFGQNSNDWEEFINNVSADILIWNLFEHNDLNEFFTLNDLYKTIENELDKIEEPFFLCGLSLGGLLALMYATQKNNANLKGIIVAGGIYKPIPRFINFIQLMVLLILPKSQFKKIGLNRRQVIHFMNSMHTNLEHQLPKLAKSTLIICGEDDKINLKHSVKMSRLIKNSEFHKIYDGKHELNKNKPLIFSDIINNFIS
ncbi:hypothetical protein IGI37_003637 [Enterococcus sp. AZ194]|uniref:alpha/beta fold hydrolase n=1 Tax=Enterococcus sp. AZ194 TaxID=2774629 RepID=UPI003F21121A